MLTDQWEQQAWGLDEFASKPKERDMDENVFEKAEPDLAEPLHVSKMKIETMLVSEEKWHEQMLEQEIGRYERIVRSENLRHELRVEELKSIQKALEERMV